MRNSSGLFLVNLYLRLRFIYGVIISSILVVVCVLLTTIQPQAVQKNRQYAYALYTVFVQVGDSDHGTSADVECTNERLICSIPQKPSTIFLISSSDLLQYFSSPVWARVTSARKICGWTSCTSTSWRRRGNNGCTLCLIAMVSRPQGCLWKFILRYFISIRSINQIARRPLHSSALPWDMFFSAALCHRLRQQFLCVIPYLSRSHVNA